MTLAEFRFDQMFGDFWRFVWGFLTDKSNMGYSVPFVFLVAGGFGGAIVNKILNMLFPGEQRGVGVPRRALTLFVGLFLGWWAAEYVWSVRA